MSEHGYRLGKLLALHDAGLSKAASTGSLLGAALAGKFIGGGLGAAYPQAMGLDPDNRVVGGALGALLGGGLGVGAHESVRYFKNLSEIGNPIVKEDLNRLRQATKDIREMIKNLKGD